MTSFSRGTDKPDWRRLEPKAAVKVPPNGSSKEKKKKQIKKLYLQKLELVTGITIYDQDGTQVDSADWIGDPAEGGKPKDAERELKVLEQTAGVLNNRACACAWRFEFGTALEHLEKALSQDTPNMPELPDGQKTPKDKAKTNKLRIQRSKVFWERDS